MASANNRKHGRNKKRKPSCMNYTAQQRWVKNKARRLKAEAKRKDDNWAARAYVNRTLDNCVKLCIAPPHNFTKAFVNGISRVARLQARGAIP